MRGGPAWGAIVKIQPFAAEAGGSQWIIPAQVSIDAFVYISVA